MIGIAKAPGTCGELVQGKTEGTDFLITCPIDMYSTVKVELNNSGTINTEPNLSKVTRAVHKVLCHLNRSEMGAVIHVDSNIPSGKGMASSTADITAACAATAAALNTGLTPQEIAGIALSIEPTDGIMFHGIAIFDHIKGTLSQTLGTAPEMEVLIIDLGGSVDTVEFNSKKGLALMNYKKEKQVNRALKKVRKAFELIGTDFDTVSPAMIGEGATISAFANQEILFKPELEYLHQICKSCGGVGVNVAHSGTVVGLLFAGKSAGVAEIANQLRIEGFTVLGKNRIIGGGVEVIKEGIGDKDWKPSSTFTEEIYGKLKKNTG